MRQTRRRFFKLTGLVAASSERQKNLAMVLYFSTTIEAARNILFDGFCDSKGSYLLDISYDGVWLRSAPQISAETPAHLEVQISLPEEELACYETPDTGDGDRQWLIQALLLNSSGATRLLSNEELFRIHLKLAERSAAPT